MSRPRVLLGDDHALIVESLRLILASDFEVAGAASDGRALIAEAERLRPDLILLDMNLPLLSGLDAARRIVRSAPEAKLVFLTQHAAPEYVQAAFRAGARGYLLKDMMRSELLAALHQVHGGAYYVTPKLLNAAARARFDPGLNPSELFGHGITAVQQAILEDLRKGQPEEEIARKLRLSAAAIRSEIEELSVDWNAQSSEELIRYGVNAGLLPK